MWKLIIGFIALAAGAVYILSKGGDVDIGGEKHSVEAPHAAAAHASAAGGTAASAAKP